MPQQDSDRREGEGLTDYRIRKLEEAFDNFKLDTTKLYQDLDTKLDSYVELKVEQAILNVEIESLKESRKQIIASLVLLAVTVIGSLITRIPGVVN